MAGKPRMEISKEKFDSWAAVKAAGHYLTAEEAGLFRQLAGLTAEEHEELEKNPDKWRKEHDPDYV